MPRTTLSSVEHVPGDSRHQAWSHPEGVPISDSTIQVTAYDRSESRTTVNTPGFRGYRQKRGGNIDDLPMNPFSYTKELVTRPFGTTDVIYGGYRDVKTGVLPTLGYHNGSAFLDSRMIDKIDNEAVIASLQDLKSQKVNLGVTFLERHQTVDLILGNAKRLGLALKDLKSGRFAKAYKDLVGTSKPPPRSLQRRGGTAKKPSKAAANEWLQLQLGVKPLVADVYALAEVLAKNAERKAVFKVSSSRSQKWNQSETTSIAWEGLPVRRFENGIYTRKYVYVFSSSNEVISSLASLGITNPLSWAWELLPLSFVIDWFLRVGDYIDTLDATASLSFYKGCTTTFMRRTVGHRLRGSGKVASADVSINAECRALYVNVVRTPLSGFARPYLPLWNPKLSLTKGVTAVALLRQFFK